MASNIFGRYIWLVDILIQHKRLTFEEINQLWIQSGLSYGEDDKIPLRTFHNHRKAIKDVFDIYIECDIKDGYRYYIDEPERLQGNSLKRWLIDSYATLNQIQVNQKLEGRILFEKIPSGNTWLTVFIEAMRNGNVVEITYQRFGKGYKNTFEIEPYYLKIFNQRWYVIGRNPYYAAKKSKYEAESKEYKEAVYRVYGLDRIKDVQITRKKFSMDKNFSIEKYFEGCCGIIPSSENGIEHIVFKAYWGEADYLHSLPLHHSQKEICSDDVSTTFSIDVKPTYDFYQMLLAKGSHIEVLEPISIREDMKNLVINMLNNYK